MAYDHERPSIAAPEARKAGDIDYLLRLLNDPDAEAREQAAYNLGRLGDPRAVPPLVGRLQASSDSMRLMVLGALASIGDTTASDDVYAVATTDNSFLVRTVAVSTLLALDDKRAASVVMSMFDDPARRSAGRFDKWALEVLVECGDPTAIPVLEAQLDAAGFQQRRRIRKAIAALREHQSID